MAPANCSIGSYNVYSSATSGFTASSANLLASGITGTTYSNPGLAAATTQYYVVEAIDTVGMSPASSQVSATTAAASTALPAKVLGATFGFNYEGDMTGPDDGSTFGATDIMNVPLYNADPKNTQASWDNWVGEAGQAGLDFICPNLRGAFPNADWTPAGMAPVIAALKNSGYQNQIKLCAFDDNGSSWQAQWSLANNGNPGPFDISNPANWTYLYDTNYKIFLQTIPDQYRLKINGRPVYMVWTGNPATVSNEQGNYSKAITYLKQHAMADFGVDPFVIVNQDAIDNDTTLAAVVDGVHAWNGQTGFTLTDFNNTKIGVAEAGLRATGEPGFEDPAHGALFNTNLAATIGSGAIFTIVEGFMDWEENAATMSIRNRDSNGDPLTYTSTLTDYPRQRLNILRQHSNNPFPATLLLQAEGADDFGGAAGGNGKTNFYRNGNIGIEPTTDTGGGFDVGFMQPGEWLEWEQVPLNGVPHFMVRIATASPGATAHFVIDGIAEPSQALPTTGGWQTWTTYDFRSYGTYTNSYHTVRIVFDNGGVNINWWQVGME
jgi:hypothetical protein